METLFRSPHRTPNRTSPTRRGGRTRRLVVVAAALALPLTTACAANFNAQTEQPYQPAAGADNREGTVYALNMLVVADGSGDGTLVGTLINQDDCPDYLVDIQVVDADGGGVKTGPLPTAGQIQTPEGCPPASAPSSGVALPSQEPAMLPEDGQIQVSADTVTPGTFITATLRFLNAEPIEMDLPVVPQSNIYADVTVGPIQGTQ